MTRDLSSASITMSRGFSFKNRSGETKSS
uniref:Uncharacterized protein n=1 Tax=Arundo donax TaxID=35708 RepID=A0A0A9GKG5_ARUDO